MNPPSPVWCDESSGLAVWVNGGLVEVTLGDGFARLTPEEAAGLPAGFGLAVAEACSWARRWDGVARSYRETGDGS